MIYQSLATVFTLAVLAMANAAPADVNTSHHLMSTLSNQSEFDVRKLTIQVSDLLDRVSNNEKKIEELKKEARVASDLYILSYDKLLFYKKDGAVFVIKKLIKPSTLNGLLSCENVTVFFSHLISHVYGDDEIVRSDARKIPPEEMKRCCEIAITLWNRGDNCFPKISQQDRAVFEKKLWDTYLRKKHSLTLQVNLKNANVELKKKSEKPKHKHSPRHASPTESRSDNDQRVKEKKRSRRDRILFRKIADLTLQGGKDRSSRNKSPSKSVAGKSSKSKKDKTLHSKRDKIGHNTGSGKR